jgi:long-chain acyl-CoA synthetase
MKPYPLYPAKDCDNLIEYLDLLKQYSEKTAVVYYDFHAKEHSFTYKEMLDQIDCCRRNLLAAGAFGKHVAIVSENSYHWLVCFLAISAAGGTAICVDIEQPDEVIRQMIEDVDSEYLFVSPSLAPICAPLVQKGLVQQLAIIGSDDDGQPEPDFINFLENGRQQPDQTTPPIDPDQTAAIMFTSGTTSKAKAVMLTHRSITINIIEARKMIDLYERIFSALPFYHSYGLVCSALLAFYGGAVFILNGDMRMMARDLVAASPLTMMAVPLMAEALYKSMWAAFANQGKDDKIRKLLNFCLWLRKVGIRLQPKALEKAKRACFGDLKMLVVGGAHIGPEICAELDAFSISVRQGYGITECSPLISVNRNEYYRFGTVGHVLPSYEIKLVDEEIWVRGPSVMKGYYKDPQSTEEVFSDGWFKTGDLGFLDKNGFLSICGRIKNLIVLKNGKKVAPERIEKMILDIPIVKEVMVYGASAGATGDDVKLAASIYIGSPEEQKLSHYEVLDMLHQEIDKINMGLPFYQQIQIISLRENEFPKTASKKIKRHML